MDQLPPDSHWATVSHSEAVAAEALPAAISGAATAAPTTPVTAMARVALDGRRCLPLPENSMNGSPHRRLRGELSGSGRLSCPATPPEGTRLHPEPCPASTARTRRLPWVPRSC